MRAVRYWLRWWAGRAGTGPYRRDAALWWITGGPLRERKPQYAQGGYIPGGAVAIPLSRGLVLLTRQQLAALGGYEAAHRLYPDSDIEVIITAAEVREMGKDLLDRLNTL